MLFLRATAFKIRKKCGKISNMEMKELKMQIGRIEDTIIIGLCTLIGGGEDFLAMEEFGREREK